MSIILYCLKEERSPYKQTQKSDNINKYLLKIVDHCLLQVKTNHNHSHNYPHINYDNNPQHPIKS